MEFSVVRGDIAAGSADALVNAAGTSLRMGGDVAGALRRGANGPINEEATSKGPVDLGGVAVTDAYDLDAGARIVCEAVRDHGAATLRDARVIAYTDRDVRTVETVADRVRP